MPPKDEAKFGCRLRIDPVLVDKFRRLQGGINEVGTKIVRDLGLKYDYDKHRGTLDILGPDEEILGLAVETLRFWIEEDEFPDTGITCQVGYPNRNIVVWRFHGDYAKKFDRLFVDDIARLKLIVSVNIKAVPTKRNPEYVELYCHFTVYHIVKEQVKRIAYELSKIFQDDFFIPKSDLQKAREFAIGYGEEDKVLYALKEYPDNKIRVWVFGRNQSDVIRARKEWVSHVDILARDNPVADTAKRSENGSVREASFIGPLGSAVTSNRTEHVWTNDEEMDTPEHMKRLNESTTITSTLKPKTGATSHNNPRVPKIDNPNFPRPPDFAYPIRKLDEPTDAQNQDDIQHSTNPFVNDTFAANTTSNSGNTLGTSLNPMAGEARWVTGENGKYTTRNATTGPSNRIYVHHQVDKQSLDSNEVTSLTGTQNQSGKQVVHPEINLVPRERYNPTHYSTSVLTSVTDPHRVPANRKGDKNNKNAKTVEKGRKKPKQPVASMRQKPKLKDNQPAVANTRFNINVNGLNIYMYKHNIVKLNNMDALVNAVTSDLKQGDIVATEMFEAMGRQVLDEINVHLSLYGEVETTENIVTSAGKIPALGIIHVVSPIWKTYTVWENCATDLHKAVYNALKTAEAHKYRKIAIPTIGSEPIFGIPKDLVAEVFVKALIDYSFGMGPMYPVLEIHLVDTDTNMLNYIKDAYESWASTPGSADEMTKHIRTGAKGSARDQRRVSGRVQSAVSQREAPSHRSENMVTFMEQSYTGHGEQKWTFDVLKRLIVHVYTGSIEKLTDVEAIVCGVDANFKGTLARSLLKTAGKDYERALKDARGNRTMSEGDVVAVNGGQLPVQLVLHSVIVGPIYTASQKNISRLDHINNQVLFTANRLGITRLAMPLIGTGRLRERFEVEQCGLQLVDNIIEMGLSLGMGLKLRELHLVNVNHVMTQSITQALRTRAHQELRMETDTIPPSRFEALSQAETDRNNPNNKIHSKSAPAQFEDENNVTLGVRGPVELERPRDASTPITAEETTQGDEKLGRLGNDKASIEKESVRKVKGEPEKGQMKTSSQNKPQTEDVPYLSQQNLETHTKLQRDAWMHDNIEDPSGTRKDSHGLEPLSEEEPRDKSNFDTKSDTEIKAANEETKRKRQRRIIQRSSDFILQKSKADSYTTLHERKQRYTDHVTRENEEKRIRKTQSNDDLQKALLNENILNGFETERIKLLKQKEQEFLEEKESEEREIFIKKTRKYFTRGTRDRYKQRQVTSDATDEFEKMTRIDVRVHEKKDDHSSTKQVTKETPRKKGTRSKVPILDHEREDAYMMDMEFSLKERGERERERDANETSDTDNEAAVGRQMKIRNNRLLKREQKDDEAKSKQQSRRVLKKNNDRKFPKLPSRPNELTRPNIADIVEDKVSKPVVYANKRELYRNLETTLQSKHKKISSIEETVRRVQERSPRKQYSEDNHPSSTWETDNEPIYPYSVYDDTKHYTLDAYVQLPRHLSYDYYERTQPPVRRALTVENVTTLAKHTNKQAGNHKKTAGPEGKKSVKSTKTSILRQNKFKEQPVKNQDDQETDEIQSKPNGEETNPLNKTGKNGKDEHKLHNFTCKETSPSENKEFHISEPIAEGLVSVSAFEKPTNDSLYETHDENTHGNNREQIFGEPLVLDPALEDVSDQDASGCNEEIIEDKTLDKYHSTAMSPKEYDKPVQSFAPIVDDQSEQKNGDESEENQTTKMSANTGETRKTFKTYTLANPNATQVAKYRTTRNYEGYQQVDDRYMNGGQQSTNRIERVDHVAVLTDQSIHEKTREPNSKKLDQETVEIIRQDLQGNAVPPRPEDVTIRDKIRLEIDVVKQSPEPLDESKVIDEKKKITRFWKVVGGRDANDEDMYDVKDPSKKEKVIVAKVTKERKMSAKSKSSKRSKMSSVHNVGGNYNVTVEVAN